MAQSSTFVKRLFAGEERHFELRMPPPELVSLGTYEDGPLGNLHEMIRRVREGTMGAVRVKHILTHALGGTHPLRLIEAEEIVSREMQGKPLGEFEALAFEIIAAAYAGVVNGPEVPE